MVSRPAAARAAPTKQKLTTEATETTEKNSSCLSVNSVISAVSHFFGSQGRFANRPYGRHYQSSLKAIWITLGGSSSPPITPKVPGARVLLGALN